MMEEERVHAWPSASTSVSRDFCVIQKRLPDCVRGSCRGPAPSVSSSKRGGKKSSWPTEPRLQNSGKSNQLGVQNDKQAKEKGTQRCTLREYAWGSRRYERKSGLASASGRVLLNRHHISHRPPILVLVLINSSVMKSILLHRAILDLYLDCICTN